MDLTVSRGDGRVEAWLGDRKAGLLEFRDENRLIVITHTEVPPELEGRGIGGALVRAALDEWRAEGRRVLPLCPFVKAWIEHHPDYGELVAGK
jgi:uncharacterized protein